MENAIDRNIMVESLLKAAEGVQLPMVYREAGKNYFGYDENAIRIRKINRKETFFIELGHDSSIAVKDFLSDKNNRMLLAEITYRDMVVRSFRLAGFRQSQDTCLLGVDEKHLFISHVDSRNKTVREALEYFAPDEVVEAKRKNVDVKRQGDWFFISCAELPKGAHVFKGLSLDRSHFAEKIAYFWDERGSHTYAAGHISHSQHRNLYLKEWHKAVRNNAIHVQHNFFRSD